MRGSKEETIVLEQGNKDQYDTPFQDYIIGIDDRIRAIRTSLGMIRKDLSASPVYLSVTLLRLRQARPISRYTCCGK
jgi:hypothetical protein